MSDYILNADIRKIEEPNKDAGPHDYQKALFYLYGNCEDLHDAFKPEDFLMAHSLLKRYEFYRETVDAKKVLTK